jgi:hypothetical protein
MPTLTAEEGNAQPQRLLDDARKGLADVVIVDGELATLGSISCEALLQGGYHPARPLVERTLAAIGELPTPCPTACCPR